MKWSKYYKLNFFLINFNLKETNIFSISKWYYYSSYGKKSEKSIVMNIFWKKEISFLKLFDVYCIPSGCEHCRTFKSSISRNVPQRRHLMSFLKHIIETSQKDSAKQNKILFCFLNQKEIASFSSSTITSL